MNKEDAFTPFNQKNIVNLADIKEKQDTTNQDWFPIIPAPSEPLKPANASMMFIYRDEHGKPVTARVRFDQEKGKKEVLPYTYGTFKNKEGWHYKAPKTKLTLFNLDKIIANPTASILIVEGEKTALHAEKIYSDFVVVTSQGGSNAVDKTDWNPLKGRKIVLWGDNDKAGQHYLQEVINALQDVYCASIEVVLLKDARLPKKWDLADPLPQSFLIDKEQQQDFYQEWIQKTREILNADVKLTNNFSIRHQKLIYSFIDKNGDAKEKIVSNIFHIKGQVHNSSGNGHGFILGFKDRTEHYKDLILPLYLLADLKQLKRYLLDAGFVVKEAELLANCLNEIKTDKIYITVDKTGWKLNEYDQWSFILPTKERWGCKDFLPDESLINHFFIRQGFVTDWKREIGQHIAKNSRLCMACCVGFAGILLEPLRKQGTGFHFVGSSSIGKTTIANIVASLFGRPKDQIKSWKTTANGLEQIACNLNHTVLILDEMSEVNGYDAYSAAYMLSNGVGKQRATPAGEARPVKQWLLNFISTGEITLKNKIAETGRKTNAGQEARLINIPADAGIHLGVLDFLPHSFKDAKTFVDHLNYSSNAYYGEVGRAFIRFMANKLNSEDTRYLPCLQENIKRLVELWTPPEADTQIKRIAEKFAVAAIAGEEATEQNLTGWEIGDATQACQRCFEAWLDYRGGAENEETIQAIEVIQNFIQSYGETRFSLLIGTNRNEEDVSSKTVNRVGYRKYNDIEKTWEYYIHYAKWQEICGSLDGKFVAQTLNKKDFLITSSNGRLQKQIRIGGQPIRFYVIRGNIIA